MERIFWICRIPFFLCSLLFPFVFFAAIAKAGVQDVVYFLEQNWTAKEREIFYFTPQGSEILPYDWARALELAESEKLFLGNENVSRFGFIPQRTSPQNPDALPVGFTQDGLGRQKMLGINCAACHTGQVSFAGKTVQIDGGASLSDFQGFIRALDESLSFTIKDPEKFRRFAIRVLGPEMARNPMQMAKLLTEVRAVSAERERWEALNGSSFTYGHGRNDAFGIIFNQVLVDGLGLPENRREPNAPVSYPVLWDAPYADIVQWIGIARNNLEPQGPLSRNIGQVLGVFGSINFSRRTFGLNGYCSSARRDKLEALEETIRTLWSPKWPEPILGELVQTRIDHGRKLFMQHCAGCHQSLDREDPKRRYEASMVPIDKVGTDPLTANNAALRTALVGALEGAPTFVVSGRPLQSVEPATVVLRHAVAGAMLGSISPLSCRGEIDTDLATIIAGWRRIVRGSMEAMFTQEETERIGTLEERLALNRSLFLRYKARPLNGIWASAPYLHNGSVKNLYEMLLPAAERSPSFWVGCTNFDPVKVGFECDHLEGDSRTSRFNANLDGNRNFGHDYAAAIKTDEDRRDLLEYLKSL